MTDLTERLRTAAHKLRGWSQMALATDPETVTGNTLLYEQAANEIESLTARLAAAEAALQRLMDVQNGPPLIRDKQEWNEAMAEACGVLRNANAMQFYLTAANRGRDD